MEEKLEGQEGAVEGAEEKADPSAGEPTEPVEEEPKQMTLDQWKALQVSVSTEPSFSPN